MKPAECNGKHETGDLCLVHGIEPPEPEMTNQEIAESRRRSEIEIDKAEGDSANYQIRIRS